MSLFVGDCLITLKTLPDNSVDSIVTDPPYGLKFMGKKWDADVPSEEIWRECLRVLKPGGHLLSFFGTRTYHRGVVRIEDAGFEIRDQLAWIYGSGFPKSHNGDHGGTALKPAQEPIVLARRPLIGTVAKNFEMHGVGGLNIDASRIGTEQVEKGRAGRGQHSSVAMNELRGENLINGVSTGRWPANVLFDEEAAAVLDLQTGSLGNAFRPNRDLEKPVKAGNIILTGMKKLSKTYEGTVGASRFFYVAKASKRERNTGLEGMPKSIGAKQMNQGMEGMVRSNGSVIKEAIKHENHHPTVKPIKLMQYLITLITPSGGTVLDPFMGSGSTGVAAKSLGFEFIGCELSEEYLEIARKRIVHAEAP